MTLFDALMLFGSAIIAGAINSVAGGGTFFTFPTLLFTGVTPVSANATNTVALWPGSLASVGAYRQELARHKKGLLSLSIISMIGGLIGAWLLLRTRDETFARLVPYLLLLATLIFTFSGYVTRWLRSRAKQRPAGESPGASRIFVPLLQLAIAIYGGFFGGGIGILMLATLALMGMEDIHEMNALKTLLATLINGIAVVLFIVEGAARWPEALVMVVGAIIGGYYGAVIAKRLNPVFVRRFVIIVGFLLTIYFFIKQ